jgi:aspartate aminotransferase
MLPSGGPKGNRSAGCVSSSSLAILSPMSPLSGLSPNLQHLETSATIAISQEAKRRKAAGEDVIDLGAGEPDFPTPSIPSDAGVRAIREGKTHYPANEGILELRAAAAKHLSLLSGGRPVNADNIVVSNGSKQSLFNVCFSLFGPGDVVAIPAPAWVSYPQIVHLSRARPVLVQGEPEWSLKVSVRDLDRVVPGARGLILCSPCNPTGAVYTHAEIKAIAQWARDRKVWVIADEIYRRIHYGTGPAPSFLDLPDEQLERVVVIYGVSKAYAMTGWRIGLSLAPGPVAKATAALQSHTTTGANHPAQLAAAAALGDDRVEQDVVRMVGEFRRRRDLVVARFRQELPGVEFVEPLGAFYFFFRVDSFRGIGGTEFCTRLITTTGVALVPGAAFGDDRYVRLSYAAATESLTKALDRIIGFAKKLSD